MDIDLSNKIITITEIYKDKVIIYFSDETKLQIWGVNRFHSGVGVDVKLSESK